MKKLLILSFVLCFWNALLHAQVPIPLALEGPNFELTPQTGTSAIFPGVLTNTVGYNGAQLGPTLILVKGTTVTLNVHNQLGDTTTVHWHGLHVAPKNDGGPHTPILAGANWSPSFEVMDHAATYWYHPHLHGKTLKQVVRGAAGFIIVRAEEEAALSLPRTYGVDDIPLVFQWKTFDQAKQIVTADEQDNEVLVNGVLRGNSLALPAQVVRLRLLNGSSHRFFNFGFADNLPFSQIGGDAGLLNAPIQMNKLLLAPGERAEILLDLTGKASQNLVLKQFGTQIPQGYPGGTMMMMGGGNMMGPLDNTDFTLINITVGPPTIGAITSIPTQLVQNSVYPQAGAGTRNFGFTAQPMMSMTNFFINNTKFDMETINFSTKMGKTEVWNLTNQTMMAHPFHVHGNSFYVLSVNGSPAPANMRGRKDVITVPPMNGTVQLVLRFDDFSDPDIPYMYHCHILSHEDTGMMGQFLVNEQASATNDTPAQNSCPICFHELTLPAGMDGSKIAQSSVFDLSGRTVKTNITPQVGGQTFDVSNLPMGIYILVMYDYSGNVLGIQRFVKQ
jgi:bilirubin oxidase